MSFRKTVWHQTVFQLAYGLVRDGAKTFHFAYYIVHHVCSLIVVTGGCSRWRFCHTNILLFSDMPMCRTYFGFFISHDIAG